jgi:hypothetical protein
MLEREWQLIIYPQCGTFKHVEIIFALADLDLKLLMEIR